MCDCSEKCSEKFETVCDKNGVKYRKYYCEHEKGWIFEKVHVKVGDQ